jgi:hypothetical protein
MVIVRLPDLQQPDIMRNYSVKAAPAANTKELKSEKAASAKRPIKSTPEP